MFPCLHMAKLHDIKIMINLIGIWLNMIDTPTFVGCIDFKSSEEIKKDHVENTTRN